MLPVAPPLLPALGAALAGALVACGSSTPPVAPASPPGPAPLLELGAHDGSARDATTAALAGIGGEPLAALLTPRLTEAVPLPLEASAPVRLVIEEDGAHVLAGRGQPAAISAAVATAWPDAVPSRASGGALWTSADAVVALHGDEVYLVRGGASSTRARAALRLADDGGLARQDPVGPGLWLSVRTDAALIGLGVAPGVATAIGAQLERVGLELRRDGDDLSWRVATRAQPGSLMDDLLRGGAVSTAAAAGAGGAVGPAGVVGVHGRMTPARAAALATLLADAAGTPIGELPADRLTGDVALSTAGLALALDGGATEVELRALAQTFGQRLLPAPAPWVAIGEGPVIGLPHGVAFTPVIVLPGAEDVLAPPMPVVRDSNDDVPASPAFELAAQRMAHAHRHALELAAVAQAAGAAVVAFRVRALAGLGGPWRSVAGELVAQQRWRPAGGFAEFRRALAELDAAAATARAGYADARAALEQAHREALRARTADVVAWDRAHGGAPGTP